MPALLLLVFALTLFASATLLFLVQPMVGKLLLPHLGGTPAVWNTCMVVFQGLLLLGYCYAHLLSRRLPVKRQALVHLGVLLVSLAPLLLLRFDPGDVIRYLPAPQDGSTVKLFGWLVLVLVLLIGLPFFAVSTSAPLLQKWFAGTDHPTARDPYFLYGASNVGSMLALLAYPAFIEPRFVLTDQTACWTVGFLGLIALTALCALIAAARPAPPAVEPSLETAAPADAAPGWPRRLHWVVLAFVPSSLMLGVTTHLTTDITPMPLLWTIPLAVYLLSFIFAFSRLPLGLTAGVALLLPVCAFFAVSTDGVGGPFGWDYLKGTALLEAPVRLYQILAVQLTALFAVVFFRSPRRAHVGMVLALAPAVLAVAFDGDLQELLGLPEHELLLLHLGTLFVACMVCHGELARDRPAAGRLTEFYLLLSLGGVLGGLFNGLAAPLLLDRVLEYPLLLAVPCLLMPQLALTGGDGSPKAPWLEAVVTGCLFVFGVLAAAWFLGREFVDGGAAEAWVRRKNFSRPTRRLGYWLARRCRAGTRTDERRWLIVNPDAVFRQESDRSGTTRGVVYDVTLRRRSLLQERNFFGSCTVEEDVYDYDKTAVVGERWFHPPDTSPPELRRRYHLLYHGTTTHGAQCMTDGLRDVPLSYFHREGPVGQLFRAVDTRSYQLPLRLAVLGVGVPADALGASVYVAGMGCVEPRLTDSDASFEPRPLKVGVVGLGTGTLAAYARPGWEMTLFEIDPKVVKVARDPRYFTFLGDAEARGVKVDVRLGDGRLLLQDVPDGHFDLLILDAFNSDSVPVHLLTREAFALYKQKLRPDGLLVVNIANRYLDFSGTMANLADDAGLTVHVQFGVASRSVEKYASIWAVMAFDANDLGLLPELYDEQATPDQRGRGEGIWLVPPVDRTQRVWSDGYSNLTGIFRWNR